MTTSALNEQFIANLVLLRCYPSENASVIEYVNYIIWGIDETAICKNGKIRSEG